MEPHPNQIDDLEPLSGLAHLQHLDCSNTRITSLGSVARLSALQNLYCSCTEIDRIEQLRGLRLLRTLDCSWNHVSNLDPLGALSRLEVLDCSKTLVNNLGPLRELVALRSLRCNNTQITSLEPLAEHTALVVVECAGAVIAEIPDSLTWRESMQNLVITRTSIPHLPLEVLSSSSSDSCLQRLRSHMRDLKAGDASLPDIKVLVLGNGRVGKTQVCNRLRALGFEAGADSTHGVTVTTSPFGEDTLFRIWDFGGQELYHGTHALFMRSRAVFVLVWTPDSENSITHEHGGMTFRNHPLGYWLAHVQHLAGPQSPVIVVQNKCDRAEDELVSTPLGEGALDSFAFRKVVHYSALNDRGRASLDEALQQAVEHLREREGQARIGKGRLAVKQRIEDLQNADAAVADPSRRMHRTMTQERFRAICAETEGVSDPALLLESLHRSGVLFYQAGLFDDQIILDQSWALDAVYAVFNRKKSWRELRRVGGRFTRTLLDALVWRAHSTREQELFLSMMIGCGSCFIYRWQDPLRGLEAEYIAPDLLPEYSEVATEVESRWDELEPCDEVRVALPFQHPGVMCNLIAQIGQCAGMTAVYWNHGICMYEKWRRSHAYVVQEAPPAGESRAIIRVRTQKGQSLELARLLGRWACHAARQLGPEPTEELTSPRPESETQVAANAAALEFATPPRKQPTYAVSYAWEDPSKVVVDKLCEAAAARNVQILRDTQGLGFGESITKLMRTLSEQDRVFVILSQKYLRSPFCMYELWHLWLNCRSDDAELRQRVRVYRLPDAAMMTPVERAQCAVFWRREFAALDELVRAEGANILGEADFQRYKLMQDFANRVGDVLATIADTLMPREFDELVAYGFGDMPGS